MTATRKKIENIIYSKTWADKLTKQSVDELIIEVEGLIEEQNESAFNAARERLKYTKSRGVYNKGPKYDNYQEWKHKKIINQT